MIRNPSGPLVDHSLTNETVNKTHKVDEKDEGHGEDRGCKKNNTFIRECFLSRVSTSVFPFTNN